MKQATTMAIICLVLIGTSCQKALVGKQQVSALELDMNTNAKLKAVPANTYYIGLFKTNSGIYAVSPSTDRCNAHALSLSVTGEVCNTKNFAVGDVDIRSCCTTEKAFYFVTQDNLGVHFYKKILPQGDILLLHEFSFSGQTAAGVMDMEVIQNKMYFIIGEESGSFSLKTFSIDTPGPIETLHTERPELFYYSIFESNGHVQMMGGYKAQWLQQRIVDQYGTVLWEATDERVLLHTAQGNYLSELDQNETVRTIGFHTGTAGSYQALYSIANSEPGRGGIVANLFQTSKGVLIFLQGNGIPLIKDLATGNTIPGTMFLRQKDGSLTHLSDETLITGEAPVYAVEDETGMWFANLFTHYGTGTEPVNNIQHMIWK